MKRKQTVSVLFLLVMSISCAGWPVSAAFNGSVLLPQDGNPKVMFSYVLNGTRIQPNGLLTIDLLRVTGLPTPSPKPGCRVCTSRPYNQTDGASLYSYVTQDGKEIGKQVWEGSNEGSYWELRPSGSAVKIPGPGSYEIRWEASGKPFYKFEFRAENGPRGLVTIGDWNDYGYLIYQDADPSRQLRFTTWLLGNSASVQNVVPELKLIRDSDGKAIAGSDKNGIRQNLLPDWKRIDFNLKPAAGDSYAFFAKDLLAVDGKYTLELKVDNAVYGRYRFEVKGGKIVKSGRQADGTDPMVYIYGGADAWFIRKG